VTYDGRPGAHQATAGDSRVRASGTEVLAGKMAPPPLGFPPLPRPRLLQALSRGVAATPVTLLSGPAGSGKTVLAASWARTEHAGTPVAWLSLDVTDDEPAAFWHYLLAALLRSGAPLPVLPPLPPDGPPPAGWPMQLAAALAGARYPVVLVIDNADCLTSQELVDALDLLVRHAGARLRLVLCARADPPLPLHRYRLDERLTEIRTDQLAFTAEETAELLASLGVPVRADVAAALQRGTEGWAAALRLAAAPLSRGLEPEELLAALTADEGSVAQYLVAEVLDHLSPPVRRFLLRISATPELWPDLVDSLTGRPGGSRVLAALAAGNAFVERAAGAPGGFRVHVLFRELLQAQLAYENPDAFAACHRICATWYADARRLVDAEEHALSAGDEELAARLLVDDLAVGRLIARGAAPGPVLFRGDTPDAAVLRVATALAENRPVSPSDLTVVAAAAGGAGTRAALRVCAAVVCALAAAAGPAVDGVHAAAASAESLVARLPDQQAPQRAELTAVLAAGQATALLRTDVAERVLREAVARALAASRAADVPRLGARCLADLALLEALVGRLRRSERLAADYELFADERGLPEGDRAPGAATAAAWVALERHELAAARGWLTRAAQRNPRVEIDRPLQAVLESRLRRAGGDPAAAEQALGTALGCRETPDWVREHVLTEAVCVRLARHDGPAALDLLERMPLRSPRRRMLRGAAAARDAVTPPGAGDPDTGASDLGGPLPLGLAVEDAVIRACRLQQVGDTRGAVAALLHALQLAEPERLRRPFLDAPPQLRPLLRGHAPLAAAGGWLNPTARAVPTPRHPVDGTPRPRSPEAPPPSIGELSPRELEVLELLAAMLSTAEVAAALFVSVNTVRTHVRSILRKLGASRRNEAVRRARELHLLDAPATTR
jgi:LuxR family maltose regulon positive regulatory protein